MRSKRPQLGGIEAYDSLERILLTACSSYEEFSCDLGTADLRRVGEPMDALADIKATCHQSNSDR